MPLRVTLSAVALLLLAGCGQPAQQGAAQPAPAPPPAPSEPSPEQIAEKLAALPAPYNAGDYANGRKLFAQCRSCHTIEANAGDRVGPHLHGLFGRTAGTAENFPYSDPLKKSGIVWDAATLDPWLAKPSAMVPGNRMTFLGVKDETARRDLIAYLKVQSTD